MEESGILVSLVAQTTTAVGMMEHRIISIGGAEQPVCIAMQEPITAQLQNAPPHPPTAMGITMLHARAVTRITVAITWGAPLQVQLALPQIWWVETAPAQMAYARGLEVGMGIV